LAATRRAPEDCANSPALPANFGPVASILVSARGKQIGAGAALAVGAIVLGALFWALLDLARIQQSHGGAEFERSAGLARGIVVVEIVGVAVTALVVVWRSRSATVRLVILAVVVWTLAVCDFWLLALAGTVPR
jgi:hypothetical protein